jgi:hypothetical protein
MVNYEVVSVTCEVVFTLSSNDYSPLNQSLEALLSSYSEARTYDYLTSYGVCG